MPKLKPKEWLILTLSSLAVGLSGIQIGFGLRRDITQSTIASAAIAVSFFFLTLFLVKRAESSK